MMGMMVRFFLFELTKIYCTMRVHAVANHSQLPTLIVSFGSV